MELILFVDAIAFFFMSLFLPGFQVSNSRLLLMASMAFAVISAGAAVLMLPALAAVLPPFVPSIGAGLPFLLFGILALKNAGVLWLITYSMEDFRMEGRWTLPVAAIFLAVVHVGIGRMLGA